MFGSTVCSMLGPGLALRGQDGAMDQAVEGLALEYRTIFMLFLTGILSFYLCFSIFLMLDTTSDWLDWMLHWPHRGLPRLPPLDARRMQAHLQEVPPAAAARDRG